MLSTLGATCAAVHVRAVQNPYRPPASNSLRALPSSSISAVFFGRRRIAVAGGRASLAFARAAAAPSESETSEEGGAKPARRRRLRREERQAEGEGAADGKKWGASARRGPTDRRKFMAEKLNAYDHQDKVKAIKYNELSGEEPRWFLVQVQPQREQSSARTIEALKRKRMTNGEFPEFEVLVPIAYEEGINPRTQRLTQMKRLIMPGYCMVKAKMTNELFHHLMSSPAVKWFMGKEKLFGYGVGEKIQLPEPMPDKQLDKIFELQQKEQEEMEARVEARPDFPFEEGDVVTATDGPYKGFSGQVMGVDVESRDVDVLLVIFSRSQSVILKPEEMVKAKAEVITRLGI